VLGRMVDSLLASCEFFVLCGSFLRVGGFRLGFVGNFYLFLPRFDKR